MDIGFHIDLYSNGPKHLGGGGEVVLVTGNDFDTDDSKPDRLLFNSISEVPALIERLFQLHGIIVRP